MLSLLKIRWRCMHVANKMCASFAACKLRTRCTK